VVPSRVGVGAINELRLERSHDRLEKIRQDRSFVVVEAAEKSVFSDNEILERGLHSPSAIGGEPDPNRPSIFGIGFATDEPSPLEVIEPIGHCSRRDQRLGQELPR
jgi:hypothetical protein